jgi:phage-related protein
MLFYATQVGDDISVLHAFQKESTQGVRTPKRELDVIAERLRRPKEILR